MPTNEERREVAARLREYTGDRFTINTCLRFALFGDYPSYLRYTDEKVLHVLADLIEPEPICIANITFTAEQQEELFQRVMEELRVSECPNCGARAKENATSDLKPCAHCGYKDTQVRWIGFTHTHNGAFQAGYRGECPECGVTTRAYDTEAEAIEAWNTRHERTCRWKHIEGTWFMSECGERYDCVIPDNYCPNCGAEVVW